MLKPVLRIHLISMRIRILDPHWKKWIRIRIQVISLLIYNKKQFQICCLIFILKLDEPFRNEEILIISIFFKNSELGFRSKKRLFLQFLVDILPPWIRIRGSAHFCGSESRKPKSCGSKGSES